MASAAVSAASQVQRELAGRENELCASTGADVAFRVRSIPNSRTPDGAVMRANSLELEAAWNEGRSMAVAEAVAYALERTSAAAVTVSSTPQP